MRQQVDGKDLMVTHSGRYFNPELITVDDIDIFDIAHALSNQCRFAGHCREFYSTAEHSVLVGYNVYGTTKDCMLGLIGLLHDAPEAYLNDMVTCVKRRLPGYYELENKVWAVIRERFGLNWDGLPLDSLPPVVHKMDMRALVTERRDLIVEQNAEWHLQKLYEPFVLPIRPLPPTSARDAFLNLFDHLNSL